MIHIPIGGGVIIESSEGIPCLLTTADMDRLAAAYERVSEAIACEKRERETSS